MTARANHFALPIRVYYEDTDAGGVVYYANYLKYLERCRSEWLRHLGFDQRALASGAGAEPGVVFVVAGVQVEYKRPARYDDHLTVSASIREHSKARLTFVQQVHRGDELLVDAIVRVACVDVASFKPTGLPPALAAALLPNPVPGAP
jgi:acyl-CoA thioester hydrolase